MGKQLGRDVGPGEPFFAWLLDGASDAERETLRGSLPGPVLAILTGRSTTRSTATGLEVVHQERGISTDRLGTAWLSRTPLPVL